MLKKKFIITIISLAILFNGCYSFYKIENDDICKIDETDIVEIEFIDGKSKVIKYILKAVIKNEKELEFIQVDSSKLAYPIDEIYRIRIEKFDYPKSFIITPIFSGLAIISVFLIIVFITGADLSVG